jgi:hypothetical protein
VNLLAEIDGQHVPIAKCDWVLWGACGCPYGVTVASYAVTEEAAWRSFFDRKRDIERAQRRGDRMELMTHERWGREVMERMMARCPHTKAGAA